MKRILPVLLVFLMACTPEEIQFWKTRTENARIANPGLPCAEWVGVSLLAGFHEHELPTVHRVMSRESGCDPNATGRVREIGLMQIHPPSWIGKLVSLGIIRERNDLYDPLNNLKAAFYIWRNSGPSNWTTY